MSKVKMKVPIHKSQIWDFNRDGQFRKLRIKGFNKRYFKKQWLRLFKKLSLTEE
jgi:hypothetical protein